MSGAIIALAVVANLGVAIGLTLRANDLEAAAREAAAEVEELRDQEATATRTSALWRIRANTLLDWVQAGEGKPPVPASWADVDRLYEPRSES